MKSYYLCIDLKSFYASVECVLRNLDPMKTNLVVADPSRGKGAICLAITPAMKKLGIRNRCRLFEIPDNVKYITALPQMKRYIEYAAKIYEIYLQYISKDDIYPYSIDEMFLDITHYLDLYKKTPIEMAEFLLNKISTVLGLPASAGIGTNLYLCKIALDIDAKHAKNSIGYLDEDLFNEKMLDYEPITDFWQISRGIANRLLKYNVKTMRGIRNLDEQIMYDEFGINAEIMIDHAYGKEPVTIQNIKSYIPKSNSISQSQILFKDYEPSKARLIVKEMVELLCLELSRRGLVSNHISLRIGYSKETHKFTGGGMKIPIRTNVYSKLLPYFLEIYDKSIVANQLVRSIGIGFGGVVLEEYEFLDLFTDEDDVKKEHELQKAILKIKDKFGKNSILKAMNLEEDATTMKRNKLIGGHNAEVEDVNKSKG